jgi:hypothetical protein
MGVAYAMQGFAPFGDFLGILWLLAGHLSYYSADVSIDFLTILFSGSNAYVVYGCNQ